LQAPLLGVSVIYVGFTTFERHRIATQVRVGFALSATPVWVS